MIIPHSKPNFTLILFFAQNSIYNFKTIKKTVKKLDLTIKLDFNYNLLIPIKTM